MVYVVMTGERHEGGRIVSIHYIYDDAIKVAKSIEPVFPGGWIEKSSDTNYYAENGCDFVSVECFEVQ